MRWLIGLISRYPRCVVFFWILLTLILGSNIYYLQIDPDFKSMMPTDHEVIRNIDTLEAIFGGSEVVIVSISDDNILNNGTLLKINSMVSEIEKNPYVSKVLALTNANEIKGTEFGFEVRDLIEELPLKSEEDFAELRRKIIDNDQIYKRIVTEDFRHTAIVALLSTITSKEADREIYEFFKEIAEKYRSPEDIKVAGFPIIRYLMMRDMRRDLKVYLPLGIILMILLLVFSFKSWAGAFLPLVVVIMSIINTVGLMSLLKVKFVFIDMLLPVMLIAIANDYSIHLVAHYYEEYRLLKNHVEAVYGALKKVMTPIFMAGITTIIGFLGLQSHIAPPARIMGLFASFGIGIAFILSITFVPAFLNIIGQPTVLIDIRKNDTDKNNILVRMGRILLKRRKLFLMTSILISIILVPGISKIVVDTNPLHYWKENNPLRVAHEEVDKNFGGTSQINIMAKGDIKSPVMLRKIETLEEYLESLDHVTNPMSIVDVVKKMNRAFHSDSVEYEVIPDNRNLISQYFLLYSMTGDPEDFDFLVDYEYSQAQIVARVDVVSSTTILRIINKVKNFIKKNLSREEFPVVTGMAVVIGELVNLIVRGQAYSLAFSIVLVFIVCAVFFKSIRTGLVSIIPLIVAMAVVFGLMGYLKIELNVATMMLSSIMIGVGVDYTIHFIYRFRKELNSGLSKEESILQTLNTTGKGIVYNALSVIVGFSVLFFSRFLPIYFFGFLIIFSIATCLMGALTLIPVVIVSIKGEFFYERKREKN
ncbi:MAG: RND family transporter [Candidatus Marinimicrobia bacterium]|nr:RND family transporter [Candidatus Neomarinimicrobiota bacterium]